MKQAGRMGFEALADGWVAGRRVLAGDLVFLTEDQAKYEHVALVALAATSEPAPAPRRKGRAK